MENIVKVFKLNRPHGLKGQIKGQLLVPNIKIEQLINKVAFVYSNNFYQPITVKQITLLPKFYLLTFKEIQTIQEIEKLTNNFLYFSDDELKKLTKIVPTNLVNYSVFYQNKKIGEVIEIFSTKAHLIIVIKLLEDDKRMLMPYVEQYVDQVDITKKIVWLKQVID